MRGVMTIALVAALAGAGCKKDDPKPPDPPAPAPTTPAPTTPAPTPTTPTAPTALPADATRPASVTQAQVKVADAFIAATEALAKDVAAAGTDCQKAVAAIEANKPKIAPIVEEARKLSEAMEADPAAKQWFQAAYVPKVMAAASIMAPLTKACMADPAFKAAATSLPMGPPKTGP